MPRGAKVAFCAKFGIKVQCGDFFSWHDGASFYEMTDMWSLLKSITGKAPESPVANEPAPAPVAESMSDINALPFENTKVDSANRYPMKDAPIPIVSIDEVVASQAELIRRLYNVLPLKDDDFNAYVMPVIRNLAAYAHLLPASRNHHHKGRGGLFRHSLEVALIAVNLSKEHIFENEVSADVKYQNAARWAVACCISAMLHDVGKLICSVSVMNRRENADFYWYPLIESLHDWATRNHLENYYISWRMEGDYAIHELVGTSLLQKIVPTKTLLYLQESNRQRLTNEFLETIAGSTHNGALLPNLAKDADKRSTRYDLYERRDDSKVPDAADTPIAAMLEDAIIGLIERENWRINVWQPDDARQPEMWLCKDGCFLDWEVAAESLKKEVMRLRLPGIPLDANIMAEKLCEGKITEYFDPSRVDNLYWYILPMKTVRPIRGEYVNPQTGEIEENAFLDNNGDRYKPQFIKCVKLTTEKRIFAHIAKPKFITALVKGVPYDNKVAQLWYEKTGMRPPETMTDGLDEFLNDDLIEEAKRLPAEEPSNFDAFGNPIPMYTMPQDFDSVWEVIEETVPIQETKRDTLDAIDEGLVPEEATLTIVAAEKQEAYIKSEPETPDEPMDPEAPQDFDPDNLDETSYLGLNDCYDDMGEMDAEIDDPDDEKGLSAKGGRVNLSPVTFEMPPAAILMGDTVEAEPESKDTADRALDISAFAPPPIVKAAPAAAKTEDKPKAEAKVPSKEKPKPQIKPAPKASPSVVKAATDPVKTPAQTKGNAPAKAPKAKQDKGDVPAKKPAKPTASALPACPDLTPKGEVGVKAKPAPKASTPNVKKSGGNTNPAPQPGIDPKSVSTVKNKFAAQIARQLKLGKGKLLDDCQEELFRVSGDATRLLEALKRFGVRKCDFEEACNQDLELNFDARTNRVWIKKEVE